MTTDPKQFTGSRLKIQRAYRHIQELEAFFQAFLKSDFCRIAMERDAQTGDQLVKLVSVGGPPPEMSLIVGDAIHNLRAALDYAIVQILGERGKREAFPVAKERDKPGSHSTYRLILKTLPELAQLLTDKIGIHDSGDTCVWSISALDNIDKHNLLITVASVNGIAGVSLKDKTRNNVISNMTLRVHHGGVFNVIRAKGGDFEITSNGHPMAEILFGKGQPLAGKSVIPTLKHLAELSFQTIHTLEAFWFGEKPKR